jgi:hypothetical protein
LENKLSTEGVVVWGGGENEGNEITGKKMEERGICGNITYLKWEEMKSKKVPDELLLTFRKRGKISFRKGRDDDEDPRTVLSVK